MSPVRRPTREAAWEVVAEQEGGRIVRGRNHKPRQVVFEHGVWVIVLDQYVESTGESSGTYTRVRTLIEPNLEFRFSIARENVFTRIGKLFGMQDVHVGNPLLDRDFVVRTDNESMTRSFLASPVIAELLVPKPSGRFELRSFRGRGRARPERAAELRWQAPGTLRDPVRLQQIVRLFRESLNRLHDMGGATRARVEYPL